MYVSLETMSKAELAVLTKAANRDVSLFVTIRGTTIFPGSEMLCNFFNQHFLPPPRAGPAAVPRTKNTLRINTEYPRTWHLRARGSSSFGGDNMQTHAIKRDQFSFQVSAHYR